MRMLCLWDFIFQYVNFKQEKVEETQTWVKNFRKFCFLWSNKKHEMENKSFWLEINWRNTILHKFWHGNRILIKQIWTNRRWAFCEINRELFHKCECFVSGILSENALISNVKKLKKRNFEKKTFREVCYPVNKNMSTVCNLQ